MLVGRREKKGGAGWCLERGRKDEGKTEGNTAGVCRERREGGWKGETGSDCSVRRGEWGGKAASVYVRVCLCVYLYLGVPAAVSVGEGEGAASEGEGGGKAGRLNYREG